VILHVLGLCGAKSGNQILQQLVGGLVLALHLVHSGFDGGDSVHMDQLVVNHIGRRHGRGLVVRRGAGEGTFGRSCFRGGGVRGEPEVTYGVNCVSEVGSLGESFPAVRATAVGRDAERDAERNVVLAGDPKGIRLLCNTNLITNIPSRGYKEERIGIHLQVRPNIQNNGYKR